MVDSDEYKAIVDRYSDETGKVNFALMNRDFMQFAAKSKSVSELMGGGAPADVILLDVVKNRAAFIANKKDFLGDEAGTALMNTLDEINPKSAFKELSVYIRRMQSKGKK